MAINKRLIKSNDEAAAGPSFNTVTYTGNGGTNAITDVGFQPDFVWIKSRSHPSWHSLQDSVRGATKTLFSNETNVEVTYTNAQTSFDANGFTLGSDNEGGSVNLSGRDYVAWNFKAGGAAVTNTDGTITSQVSANTEAGFSIVSYTGNGATSATLGHGLSDAPKMYIVKSRGTGDWLVYNENLNGGVNPASYFLRLNLTNAETLNTGTPPSVFAGTEPTESVFSIGATLNASSTNYIAYCFAEVAGFSKFGSYVGGTANNPITLGFEPAFVMIKSYSGVAEYWAMYDNKRSPSNPVNDYLVANESFAENVNNVNQVINFDDNGFTLVTTNSLTNLSGSSYIYMAFANQF